MLAGDKGSLVGFANGLLAPDACGEGEQSAGDAGVNTGDGAPSVVFKSEPSRFSCRRLVGGVTGRCAVSLSVVVPLVLLGWDVPEVAVESFVVIPGHPLEGDLLGGGSWA